MKYLIIGLGIYGQNLALNLTTAGHEVIAADICPERVDALKNDITTVYVLDSTEESQLALLPLRAVDLAIVAIGKSFGANVKTVALLKKAGVKHIYARAIDKLHEAILSSFEIERIVTPEQRAAYDITLELALGFKVRTMRIDEDNIVVRFQITNFLTGLTYQAIRELLGREYALSLVSASRPKDSTDMLGLKRERLGSIKNIDPTMAMRGDIITVAGNEDKIAALIKKIH